MPSSEPMLFDSAKSNQPGEHLFSLTLVHGAAALASTRGTRYGGLTVTRPGTGQIKVALPRSYARRTHFSWSHALWAAGALVFPVVVTNNCTSATDPHVVIEFRTETGTATDPASGNETDICLGFTYDVLGAT